MALEAFLCILRPEAIKGDRLPLFFLSGFTDFMICSFLVR